MSQRGVGNVATVDDTYVRYHVGNVTRTDYVPHSGMGGPDVDLRTRWPLGPPSSAAPLTVEGDQRYVGSLAAATVTQGGSKSARPDAEELHDAILRMNDTTEI